MSEAKRKRIVYAIFIVAVIWGLYNQPWKRPSRDTGPVKSTSPAEAQAQVAASIAQAPMQRPRTVADAPNWTSNPFRPMNTNGAEAVAAPEDDDVALPMLQGTMTVGARQLCVLDGRVHRVGDQVGIWTVADIKAGYVTLTGPTGESVKLSTSETES
ncbi:MAG: hypothetical protein GF341_07910 [candidate division Zixibacteria bacterium]|nr:hypothetical protein [candidate division Zixibacteria bacterium]